MKNLAIDVDMAHPCILYDLVHDLATHDFKHLELVEVPKGVVSIEICLKQYEQQYFTVRIRIYQKYQLVVQVAQQLISKCLAKLELILEVRYRLV